MKKRTKILLVLLAALLTLLAALACWQWNNLKALYYYLTLDEDTIAQQMEDAREDHRQTLERDHAVTIRPPNRQQSDDLLDGKISAEEVKQQLGIGQAPSVKKKTAEELINECVAELYACKVDLMETLGGMKQNLLEQWKALPAHERTRAKRTELGMDALEVCYEMEVTTDEQVEAILDKYRPLVKEAGGDMTVFADLWKYYCEEKASEKAYYMNKYL